MLELTIIAGTSPDNPTLKTKCFDDRGGVIGRDSAADWPLFDVSRVISSQHAKVIFSQGAYYLSDLSANGIMTEQGQKLRKGEYRLLKTGEVYVIGAYHIEVTKIETQDKAHAFKEAGLVHILEDLDLKDEDLSPLQYAQKQNDPLAMTENLNDFPFKERPDTLKAFDFMPEPFDFSGFESSTESSTEGSFITQFCMLFNLNAADFEGIPDLQFKQSMECLFRAMSKKMGEIKNEAI